jgi:branched-chain amino acid aminotransferase
VTGSQDYEPDPRNETVRVYVNGELVPRSEAVVSVFDAGFTLGDGVWEGFRVHAGQLPFAEAHLDRLFWGANAIRLDIGMTREEIRAALEETIAANGMVDGVHVRLMVTRGTKRTPAQDPRLALGRPTVVIVAEWKEPRPEVVANGLSLFTSSVRCTRAEPPAPVPGARRPGDRAPLPLDLTRTRASSDHAPQRPLRRAHARR